MLKISRESEINLINVLIDNDVISGKDLINIKKTSTEGNKSQIEAVFSFIAIYITFFLIFMFVLIFQDVDFYSSFAGTAAAINNLGPGLGELSENYSSLSNLSKITLASAMIVGRLELFGVLILLVPAYWRS